MGWAVLLLIVFIVLMLIVGYDNAWKAVRPLVGLTVLFYVVSLSMQFESAQNRQVQSAPATEVTAQPVTEQPWSNELVARMDQARAKNAESTRTQ